MNYLRARKWQGATERTRIDDNHQTTVPPKEVVGRPITGDVVGALELLAPIIKRLARVHGKESAAHGREYQVPDQKERPMTFAVVLLWCEAARGKIYVIQSQITVQSFLSLLCA